MDYFHVMVWYDKVMKLWCSHCSESFPSDPTVQPLQSVLQTHGSIRRPDLDTNEGIWEENLAPKQGTNVARFSRKHLNLYAHEVQQTSLSYSDDLGRHEALFNWRHRPPAQMHWWGTDRNAPVLAGHLGQRSHNFSKTQSHQYSLLLHLSLSAPYS